ncbi:MAG TPA: hypothetical protein PKG48_08265 [Bacteroidales bacterium]|nr:hypothetical protein [Bacteroidales bacterium]HPS61879.1 hypothetical protein [Bacteroidales bacterium]
MNDAREINRNREEIPSGGTERPLLLTLVCLFSFIFFGVITLLFLVATLRSGSIAALVVRYLPGSGHSPAQVLMLLAAATIAHATGIAGTVLVWRMKKPGYYLLSIASLLIASAQLLLPGIALGGTVVYIVIVILFGLFFRYLR